MSKKNTPLLLLIAGCLTLGVALFLFPRPAAAQCGSSVSSCKNCHEVQGKDPVNSKGAWHQQHAFGDFCEFCHAGNVKAKDEAGAHAGLVEPLADVKASCQSCHANDYMQRAKTYADTLGKPLGTGAATSSATPATGAPAGTLTGTGATGASGGVSPCGPSAPTGGQVIDLNKVYAGLDSVSPTNWGNYILIALIGATLLVLVGLVWHYEKPLPRALAWVQNALASPLLTATTPEGVMLQVPAEVARRVEFGQLERTLASSDPATVRAISQLLSDREHGPKILKALSHADLQTLNALGETDQKALAAVLALVKEMKE